MAPGLPRRLKIEVLSPSRETAPNPFASPSLLFVNLLIRRFLPTTTLNKIAYFNQSLCIHINENNQLRLLP